MNSWITKINNRLWVKVMIPVCAILLAVMATSLWFNVRTQTRLGINQLSNQNKSLCMAVEGGMFDALATGDNDTVRAQFNRLGEKVPLLKVYVYNFNKTITFSTDPAAVGRSIDDYVSTKEAALDIAEMIDQGRTSHQSFTIDLDQEDYIIKSDPILNEKRCYHCHGKRGVLGGVSVLSSMGPVQQGIDAAKRTSIMICTAGLGVIVALIWGTFFFLVNKKVNKVMETAERLRHKDFTPSDKVGKGDEINHILNRLNRVSTELGDTIRQVITNSQELANASTSMSKIAQTLDTSSVRASDKAGQVSAAVEQMNVTNKAIASAMGDATHSLTAFASAVEEMSATVGEIAKNSSESKGIIEQMVSGFDQILNAVKNLGQQADEVDAVTDEIRSMSEQVSLLALNAKIEAARAGESGKGFAVVAQEITDLAMDSNQATVKADEKLAAIKSMSRNLMDKVSSLTEHVKNSDRAVAGIAAAVEEQNVSTQEISRNINEVNEKISEVNERVAQGARATDEIARSIVEVEEISSEVGDQSHHLNEAAKDLSEMAEHFFDLMKQFKV